MKNRIEKNKKLVQEYLVRLNKHIANSGYTSRRSADELIKQGNVKVNNLVITNPGHKINPELDTVYVNSKKIKNFNEELIYIVLNKPAGCICSTLDERTTVFDYLPSKYKKSLINVGRLDYNSEGILLFTNDKPIINKLTHPKFGVRKKYLVRSRGIISENLFKEMVENGILIDGTTINNIGIRDVRYANNTTWFEIEVGEGRNREIRKIVEKLGFEVSRLKRIAFGQIYKNIPPKGKFRPLSKDELKYIKSL